MPFVDTVVSIRMARPTATSIALVIGVVGVLSASCSRGTEAANFETLPGMVATLEVNGLALADVHAVYGKPLSSESKSDALGQFVIHNYSYVASGKRIAELSAEEQRTKWRGLTLEFRDGRLNGWHNWGAVDMLRLSAVFSADPISRPQVDKGAVLEHLGKPTGKALCPSQANAFKHRCRAREVWRWDYLPETSAKYGAPRELYVHFDEAGTVRQVELANPQTEARALQQQLVELARRQLVPLGFVEQPTKESIGWYTRFVRAPHTVSVGFDLREESIFVQAWEDDHQRFRALYSRFVAPSQLTTAFGESVQAALQAKLQEYVARLADDAQRQAGSSRPAPTPLTRSDVGVPAPTASASSR